MIREELLHTALIHFPIAIFSLALVFKFTEVLCLCLKKKVSYEVGIVAKALLFIGPLFYLVSIYLGDMAFEIIKKDLCNITLAYQHEEAAEIPIPFFLLAIVLEVLILAKVKSIKTYTSVVQGFILLSLLIGNILMFRAAHLGGEMVYDHGAAVKGYTCPKK